MHREARAELVAGRVPAHRRVAGGHRDRAGQRPEVDPHDPRVRAGVVRECPRHADVVVPVPVEVPRSRDGDADLLVQAQVRGGARADEHGVRSRRIHGDVRGDRPVEHERVAAVEVLVPALLEGGAAVVAPWSPHHEVPVPVPVHIAAVGDGLPKVVAAAPRPQPRGEGDRGRHGLAPGDRATQQVGVARLHEPAVLADEVVVVAVPVGVADDRPDVPGARTGVHVDHVGHRGERHVAGDRPVEDAVAPVGARSVGRGHHEVVVAVAVEVPAGAREAALVAHRGARDHRVGRPERDAFVVAVAARVRRVEPGLRGGGVGQRRRVVAVRAAVGVAGVPVEVLVVVGRPVAVAVDPVVPSLGVAGPRVRIGVEAVVAAVGLGLVAVEVLVVVGQPVAVPVDAVVPDLRRGGVDRVVGVVAVVSAPGRGVVPVYVLIVVRQAVAVPVRAVVPGLGPSRVHRGPSVVAVGGVGDAVAGGGVAGARGHRGVAVAVPVSVGVPGAVGRGRDAGVGVVGGAVAVLVGVGGIADLDGGRVHGRPCVVTVGGCGGGAGGRRVAGQRAGVGGAPVTVAIGVGVVPGLGRGGDGDVGVIGAAVAVLVGVGGVTDLGGGGADRGPRVVAVGVHGGGVGTGSVAGEDPGARRVPVAVRVCVAVPGTLGRRADARVGIVREPVAVLVNVGGVAHLRGGGAHGRVGVVTVAGSARGVGASGVAGGGGAGGGAAPVAVEVDVPGRRSGGGGVVVVGEAVAVLVRVGGVAGLHGPGRDGVVGVVAVSHGRGGVQPARVAQREGGGARWGPAVPVGVAVEGGGRGGVEAAVVVVDGAVAVLVGVGGVADLAGARVHRGVGVVAVAQARGGVGPGGVAGARAARAPVAVPVGVDVPGGEARAGDGAVLVVREAVAVFVRVGGVTDLGGGGVGDGVGVVAVRRVRCAAQAGRIAGEDPGVRRIPVPVAVEVEVPDRGGGAVRVRIGVVREAVAVLVDVGGVADLHRRGRDGGVLIVAVGAVEDVPVGRGAGLDGGVRVAVAVPVEIPVPGDVGVGIDRGIVEVHQAVAVVVESAADLGRARVHRRLGVVTVGAPVGEGDVAIPVRVQLDERRAQVVRRRDNDDRPGDREAPLQGAPVPREAAELPREVHRRRAAHGERAAARGGRVELDVPVHGRPGAGLRCAHPLAGDGHHLERARVVTEEVGTRAAHPRHRKGDPARFAVRRGQGQLEGAKLPGRDVEARVHRPGATQVERHPRAVRGDEVDVGFTGRALYVGDPVAVLIHVVLPVLAGARVHGRVRVVAVVAPVRGVVGAVAVGVVVTPTAAIGVQPVIRHVPRARVDLGFGVVTVAVRDGHAVVIRVRVPRATRAQQREHQDHLRGRSWHIFSGGSLCTRIPPQKSPARGRGRPRLQRRRVLRAPGRPELRGGGARALTSAVGWPASFGRRAPTRCLLQLVPEEGVGERPHVRRLLAVRGAAVPALHVLVV